MIIILRTLLLSMLVMLNACSSSSTNPPRTVYKSPASAKQNNYLASSIAALTFLKQHCHYTQLGSEKEILNRIVNMAASKGFAVTESDQQQLQMASLQRYQTIVDAHRDAENCQSFATSLTTIINQAYKNNSNQ